VHIDEFASVVRHAASAAGVHWQDAGGFGPGAAMGGATDAESDGDGDGAWDPLHPEVLGDHAAMSLPCALGGSVHGPLAPFANQDAVEW